MDSSDTRTYGLLEETFPSATERAGLGRLVDIAVSQSIAALLFGRFEVIGISLLWLLCAVGAGSGFAAFLSR